MHNKTTAYEVYKFLIENELAYFSGFEHLGVTEKGRRLLDYLGFTYDSESVMLYQQVFREVPSEHKEAIESVIELVTNKNEIGRKVSHFQWIHTIIVPILYNDGEPIPQNPLNELKTEFVAHFGGATQFEASGNFLSKYGNQKDRCEVWQGFGKNENHEQDKTFLTEFAIKVGSNNFCKQDAVTFFENPGKIEIIDTLDMKKEIDQLRKFRLFSIRSMVILAIIAGTSYSEQNRGMVANVADALGFDGW